MRVNLSFTSLSLTCLMTLVSALASAETVKFSLTKSQLELPETCGVASDATKPVRKVKVKCSEPSDVIKYRESSYAANQQIFKNTHAQARELFAKNGFTVKRIQEIKVKPLKSGGEISVFAMVMTQKDKVIAQVYTLVSFDKKTSILITYTYEPSVGAKVRPARMKQLSAFKPLSR